MTMMSSTDGAIASGSTRDLDVSLPTDPVAGSSCTNKENDIVVVNTITSSSSSTSLYRKWSLVVAIVVALYLLCDDSWTVWYALQMHEPSMRIFRALMETVLSLFGVAVSLQVWYATAGIGSDCVRELLFLPASSSLQGSYRVTASAVDDNDDDDDDNNRGQSAFIQKWAIRAAPDGSPVDVQYSDADYQSDGEMENPGSASDTNNNKWRSATNTTPHLDGDAVIVMAPLPAHVWNAALDVLLIILVALFLYALTASGIMSTSHPYLRIASRVAAPTFPLILFVYLMIAKCILPWKEKRQEFWAVVWLTLAAPWAPVTFRDGFVGDIMTSAVRPMQDMAFTLFYLAFGLRGWWSQEYFDRDTLDRIRDAGNSIEDAATAFLEQADANRPELEKSWLLHTIVLPMCMISPLWCRFLQNLRQCYEAKQRWPYLGNAFKYFIAAQVAMWGVFQPGTSRESKVWLSCFVMATLYQIWWDVVMDWGLLERNPTSGSWQLRKERLFGGINKSTSFYYVIAILNVLLRFCWTLSFVPPRYINAAGVLEENWVGDMSVLGPLIASAEIVRRTMWGWLRLEWELAKVRIQQLELQGHGAVDTLYGQKPLLARHGEVEMMPMKVTGDDFSAARRFGASAPQVWVVQSDMSSMNDIQVMSELSLYATAFAVSGLVAAVYRGTL